MALSISDGRLIILERVDIKTWMLFKFFLITVFIRKNETRRLHMLSLGIFEDLS